LKYKTLAVVGYGNIGSTCAMAAKRAFGMRVIGVNKFPEMVTKEERAHADEVVGLDQYERVVKEADFILGSLPKMVSTDNFFNGPNCFSKMKKDAVFMNIGRGTTVDEEDLANALYSGTIRGAVLDVFKKEPLPVENRLWYAPNLFMTPHCADQDKDWLLRTMDIFGKNLANYVTGQNLVNPVDKEFAFQGASAAKL
jgi:D-2-hydroxyacid dehydrogenase (NADP+)